MVCLKSRTPEKSLPRPERFKCASASPCSSPQKPTQRKSRGPCKRRLKASQSEVPAEQFHWRGPPPFAFFSNEGGGAGPAYAALLTQAPLGKAVRRPMIATS